MIQSRGRSSSDYVHAVEAALALTLAKLAIGLLPFRMVAASTNWRSSGHFDPESMWRAENVVVAIERVARRLPWRSVCFDQGLAAHWMLRRRRLPSIIHYGIGSNESRLTAHVWISLGGKILLGESEAARHAQVATFPNELS